LINTRVVDDDGEEDVAPTGTVELLFTPDNVESTGSDEVDVEILDEDSVGAGESKMAALFE
jgi:hypothetical protein